MTPKNLNEYYASKGKTLGKTVQDRFADQDFAAAAGRAGYTAQNYTVDANNAEANTKIFGQLMAPPPAPAATSTLPMTSPSSPVVTSSPVRGAITERGQDPQATSFSGESAFTRFKDQVQPKTAAPSRPSFVDDYTKLKEDAGIKDLEDQLQGLDDEDGALDAELRKFSATEGEGQSQRFTVGRISEAERAVRERKDYLTRQKTSLTNRINSANKTIETIMSLGEKDYTTARGEYEFEFNKNMQLYSAFEGDQDKDQAAARSNLQIIYNNIKDIDSSKLPPSQQAAIAKMEMEAGLPVGFYLSVKKELPDSKIISTTTRDKNGSKVVDLVYQDPDGSIRTASIPFGGGSSSDEDTGGDTPTWEEYLAAAEAELGMNIVDEGKGAELMARLRAQYDSQYGAGAKKPAAASSSSGRSI